MMPFGVATLGPIKDFFQMFFSLPTFEFYWLSWQHENSESSELLRTENSAVSAKKQKW